MTDMEVRTEDPLHGSFDAEIPRRIRAVDVFCGIGGLTHGLRAAGIHVAAGVDFDRSCRFAYEINNPGAVFLEEDVCDISFSDLESHYGESSVRALVGCAPCQPFSAHTRRTAHTDDCELVGDFARLVREGTPDLVSMENVPGLSKHDSFRCLVALLKDLGYDLAFDLLKFQHYGVPQRRQRLVMVASRVGPIALPTPTGKTTAIVDFIRDLEPIEAGETCPGDPEHRTLPLSPTNLKRIRQSKPGGTWKDWDEALINPCHARAHYPASYGRLQWTAPAPTITTQFCYYSTGRFGHPHQDRALSIREGALLQTFPADYRLVNPEEHLPIHKLAGHIGNAVPVKIGELIGNSLVNATYHA